MSFPKSLSFVNLLTFALVTLAGVTSPLSAQSSPEWIISLKFDDIEGENVQQPTGGTTGGGVRGRPSSCAQEGKTSLTSLTPKSSPQTLTVLSQPTFFVYVPETQPQLAEFALYDEGRELFQTNVTLSGRAGVVQISLPETKSLQIDKDYLWQFTINCPSLSRGQNEMVWGVIRRTGEVANPATQPGLSQLPEQEALLKQAQILADAKIWQDSLALLAQIRSSRPQEWEQFLKSVGLDEIAEAPFIDCCTIEN
ncbi:MAG: DUF928 domain-containing protein [Coleofasciculaceae cyanobacterium]